MEQKEAIELLERYRMGQSSEKEKALVEEWYKQLSETGNFQWDAGERESLEKLIHNRLMGQIAGKGTNEEVIEIRGGVIKMWKRIAVAASIILVLGVGGYLAFYNTSLQPDSTNSGQVVGNDVQAPETARAMITLADGSRVYLDSANNGELAVQGNIKLVKLEDGRLAYVNANGEAIKELKYNTVFNPRGSKVIDIKLADGSQVWLNSGSSVTFPIAFVGKERKVSIEGEAYFEVAHDAIKPFSVNKGEVSVEVLGTHFNVNAYDDEEYIIVTLLEGSVMVKRENVKRKGVKLVPGQSAVAKGIGGELSVVNGVDIEAVMAWKNGYFHFAGASLQEVMRQIGRWYDVEVVYQEGIKDRKFGGEISRKSNLSQVLKILEESKVHFSIEGKKLIVKP